MGAYSMPYIFGKLWHLAIIWPIRKAFQCILQGVRILLAKYTRISPTSDNESYLTKIDLSLPCLEISKYLRDGWKRATEWMWRDPKEWSHLSRLSESGQKQKDTFSYYDVTLRQLVER